MQPYTEFENEWISETPLTPAGHIDVVAVEAAARRARARMLGHAFARLFGSWKGRAQAATVQRELDRAALGMGK